jgi:hypothetical protein
MNSALKIKPEEALKTTELNIKLDYLINSYMLSNDLRNSFVPFPSILIFMAIVMIIMMTNLVDRAIAYFFPKNIFLFGKQKTLYEKRRGMTDKILWGVLIAFIVSLFAGIATKIF